MIFMVADPWDGIPLDPETKAWHWLENDGVPCPFLWVFYSSPNSQSFDRWEWQDASGRVLGPASHVARHWRYIGRCLLPNEVADLTRLSRNRALEDVAYYCESQAAYRRRSDLPASKTVAAIRSMKD